MKHSVPEHRGSLTCRSTKTSTRREHVFHLNGKLGNWFSSRQPENEKARHRAVMNRSVAATILSKFKNSLNSWISFWHFLVHLENLDFYEGLDELDKREMQRTREAQGSDVCVAIEKRSEIIAEQKTGSLRKSVMGLASALGGRRAG